MLPIQDSPEILLTGTYHWGFVTLSYMMAVFASLTAIYLVECIKECKVCDKKYWILGLAFTMGGGIWSMHFIGMMAFMLPIPVNYDLSITVLSLLISIMGAGCAIYAIHGKEFNKERIHIGALVMGLGIAAMHYTGMEAMIMSAQIHYNPWLVLLSVLIAMSAAWAALWIVSSHENQLHTRTFPIKALGSLILGFAITGMHYTGMMAASFVGHQSPDLVATTTIDRDFLAVSIILVTVIIFGIAITAAIAQAKLKSLEKINEELEQRVAERTNELHEKNRELDQAFTQAIEYASFVQKGFLPENAPDFPGISLSAKTVPARLVGGDFYDFISVGNKQLGILLGDVSGKGVSAALYMARLVSDFRFLSQTSLDPELIMNQINNMLFKRSEKGMFSTAIFGVLDIQKNILVISNAGHPGILIRNKKNEIIEKAKAHGPPLGILQNYKYSKEEIHLRSGQLVLAYTDGVTEPKNSQNRQFGIEGLQSFLDKNEKDPEEVISQLVVTIKDYVGSLSPHDDLTCLALKVS